MQVLEGLLIRIRCKDGDFFNTSVKICEKNRDFITILYFLSIFLAKLHNIFVFLQCNIRVMYVVFPKNDITKL